MQDSFTKEVEFDEDSGEISLGATHTPFKKEYWIGQREDAKEVEFDSEQMGHMYMEQTLDDIALTKEELKDKVIFPESNNRASEILINVTNSDVLNEVDNSIELNKKNTSSKLGEVIENAEKTVNSIGEK